MNLYPLVLIIGLGLPLSYALNRRFSARTHQRIWGRVRSRATSLAMAAGIWADGAVLYTGIVIFPTMFWVVVGVWVGINYAGAVAIIFWSRRVYAQRNRLL